MDQREEIKARLSIYDLVSEYVELKKAGRNFKGLCPFHNEKSPSFIVSPDKELAYCFGCHKGGDIFGFYQTVEGVDFYQALKDLAQKTGVELQEVNREAINKAKDRKEVLIEIHEHAAELFQKNLLESDDGKKVYQYVIKRGITPEIIAQYKLGFSLESYDQLYKFLLSKGYSKEVIVESGLASAKDTNLTSLFDRFRLRLMIPIFSKDNKVVAFGGRALKQDENAKYLNSPETPIYHKSDILFGFNLAKDTIRKSETVIIVEGYFDQMAVYQAGFKNVVAVSGTALTPRHLQLLKKSASKIIFCFDSDNAGREALYRSAELAMVEGFNLKVLDLRNFKDPAEMIQSDSVAFSEAVENAKDFFERFIELEFLSIDSSQRFQMESISSFLQKSLPVIQKINSDILKDIVVRRFAQVLEVKVDFIYQELAKVKSFKATGTKKEDAPKEKIVLHFAIEDHFWGYLFSFPQVLKNIFEEFEKSEFLFSEKQVYKFFMDNYNNQRDLKEILLSTAELPDEIKKKLSIVGVYLESFASEDWSEELVIAELLRLLARLKLDYKKREGSRLEAEIRLAEGENNMLRLKELLDLHRKVLSL
jgi:DNA primase